ncbi:hypothetical protein NBRC10513_002960, partial [Rhodotorula toruloides]
MSRQPSYSSEPLPECARRRQTPVFRTLVFGGNVPIQVVLAEDELPAQADRSIEVHYVQAPRTAYLPLLLPQIRKYFVNLVLDDNTAASLRDQDLCFKADGVPLKWHWPVGLLYDYHYLANQPSLYPPRSSTSTADSALPSSLPPSSPLYPPLQLNSPSTSP